jgi:hypothetical protein
MATYRVLNPRNVPKGIHILRTGAPTDKDGVHTEGTLWYADDTFVTPATITNRDALDLVSKGLLEKVS